MLNRVRHAKIITGVSIISSRLLHAASKGLDVPNF
jgi:hypothetical protein